MEVTKQTVLQALQRIRKRDPSGEFVTVTDITMEIKPEYDSMVAYCSHECHTVVKWIKELLEEGLVEELRAQKQRKGRSLWRGYRIKVAE